MAKGGRDARSQPNAADLTDPGSLPTASWPNAAPNTTRNHCRHSGSSVSGLDTDRSAADTPGARRGTFSRWLSLLSCLCGGSAFKFRRSTSVLSDVEASPAQPVTQGLNSTGTADGRSAAWTGMRSAATASIGYSAESQLAPLPLNALQCLPDNVAAAALQIGQGSSSCDAALVPSPAVAAFKHPTRGGRPLSAHGGSNGQPQVVVLTRCRSGNGATGGSTQLGVSRASSRTSAITTTSRPSRWGVLANILAAGLRSFTQIAHIVEPNTGNLTLETVHDLARRAGRLDMLRAVGQFRDLSLVGSGSMGLVYRGRVEEGGAAVCVKYVVSRGADGMAAMATEGLLSRALSHPNIVATLSWHVTRVTSDNFLDLRDALAAMATRRKRKAAKQTHRAVAVGKGRRGDVRHAVTVGGELPMSQAGTGATPMGTSVPLPQVGHIACGAAEDGGNRRKSCDFNACGGFTSNGLDVGRGLSAAGAVGKARPASPHGSPMTRIGSLHGSFTIMRRGVHAGTGPALLPVHLSPSHYQHAQTAAVPTACAEIVLPPQSLLAPPGDGARTHCEGSWSVRRGELYGMNNASNSLLQQAAACDAAAVATSNVGPSRVTGTSNALFSRESLSGHWFGPSPNTSCHRRSVQDVFSRSTLGDGSSHYNGAAYTASLAAGPLMPAAQGMGFALVPQVPSAPVTVAGAVGRPSRMLVRAGSRLQVATTPGTHPSMPQDLQRAALAGDVPGPPAHDLGGGGGENISFADAPLAAAVAQPEEGRAGLQGLLSRALPFGGGSGRHLAVTAAAPASADLAIGSSLGDAASILSAGSVRLQPTPFTTDRAPRTHVDVTSDRTPLGLLASAFAAAQAHGSPSGLPSLHGVQSVGGRNTPTLSRSTSRTTSTALAFTRTTTSSKRFSSAATVPPVGSVPPPAGAAAAAAASSTAFSTPSGHGSGPGDASYMEAAVATAAAGVGAARGSSGGALGAEAETVSAATASAAASLEAEAAKREALERGWRTLQHIMHRLNAKPGDFLTRIVMEDADQGSLLIALRNGRFDASSRPDALQALLLTALDMARGMDFLHSQYVIHGDFKPSNVLLRSDSEDCRGFVAKVSDFGLSRILHRGNDSVHNPEALPAGTVAYMAPETVNGSSFKASDVWSYGVVLWQLVTGEAVPWPGLRNVQIMMGVLQGDLRLTIPPSAYPPLAHLVESCLAREHTQRPSFGDIVLILEAMLRDLSRSQPTSRATVRDILSTVAGAPSQPSTPSAPSGGNLAACLGVPGPDCAPPAAVHIPIPMPIAASAMPLLATPASSTLSRSLVTGMADDANLGGDAAYAGGGLSPRIAVAAAIPGAREVPLPPGGMMARPSLGATSASLTAPGPSSHALTHMSSSWANTSATERDHRSSAWQSSALHLTAATTATAHHFGGFGASSLGHSVGVSNSSSMAMLEGRCLQDLYSRQRVSEDSMGPEEGAAAGHTGLPHPYRHPHLSIYNPLASALVIGGSCTGSGGLARASAGCLGAGGGSGVGHAPLGPAHCDMLPIVHEEQPSGSACPTSQGSRASSFVPQTCSYGLQRRGSTGLAFGAGEGSLPGLLQQGLMVLGAREGRGSSKSMSVSVSAGQRPASGTSSQVDMSGCLRPEESAGTGNGDPRYSSGRNVSCSGPVEPGCSEVGYSRK